MTDIDLTQLAAQLDAKADELRAQIAELTRPAEAGSAIGFGKRIGDGTTQAIQQMADASSAQNLQHLLDQVVRARAKIERGNYGRCDVCGEEIPAARLQFRPWSATCVTHA